MKPIGGEITILIRPDGSTEVQVQGVKGRACADVDKFLRDALGRDAGGHRTGEWYESESERLVAEVRG